MATFRLLVWNCQGGISTEAKILYFKSFSPDIAVIPEIRERHIDLLGPEDHIWHTNNHSSKSPPKGLGILAFNGFKLIDLDRDPEMEIFIPLRVEKGEANFNLLAVWNFYHASKQGRFKGVRGYNSVEFQALKNYNHLFSDPSIVAGDWNLGPTLSLDHYARIVSTLAESNLHCLYHKHHKLSADDKSAQTYRHNSSGNMHWIDHIFGSQSIVNGTRSFGIDSFKNVVGSDHAPLILEFEI